LLTRGDTLGGRMRNFAGRVGEWKFTRLLISTLSVCGRTFQYSDSVSPKWLESENEVDLEKRIKGIHWFSGGKPRTLLYNKKVPLIRKNVDLCLFDCLPEELRAAKNINPSYQPEKYLALGELKGGIDPGGADEHWKTANSALNRIREGFANKNCHPYTFFIGAAIAKAMAKEIYRQLEDATLANAANLTHDKQTISLCTWLINL
ncbi:MAG: AvaI/BsoBI family type II restriction endonuclease, partial [Cyanobacteriota bacterium]|nr:AvaI/BsoBI family type II restriction endonuclease [Cyanobacteriota bacterium]